MRIYLVRHGQHKTRRGMNMQQEALQGLTRLGRRQAKAVAKELRKWQFDVLYTSPIKRTRETADIISKYTKQNPVIDERLQEFRPSLSLSGKKYKELKKKVRQERDFIYKDGESFNQSIERFEKFITGVDAQKLQSICVVSHSMLIQNILLYFFNLETAPHIDFCSMTTLEYEQGEWKLVKQNENDYLPYGFWSRVKSKLRTVLGM